MLDDDLRAAVAADRELGGDYEAAVVRALGERLDAEIDRRVDERLAARRRSGAAFDFLGLVLVLASIGMAIGVPSAIHGSVGSAGTFVLTLVAWAAIAAVNVAFALGRRRP